jgi:type III restriction enzyme
MKLILRDIVENIDFEELNNNWRGFDFESFSESKKLYDFQKKALENILKLLWFYYEKCFDFKKDEDLSINNKRKEKLFREYLDYRLSENEVDHPYKEEAKHKFIFDYFPLENQRISFKHFINRAGFWMATGSGKTLIIVKLIEILKGLIKREEIPDYDILFLTYRDDLIDQFKKHIQEYNQSNKNKILLHDLKDYEKIKRNYLFKENFVFYYRSDLLSDEQKEKILDFKNYYNDGKWYIILDEAHKGDKEDSKRQHIFSILSKNGFLFNFSATFDDIRDLITTCFEYNLYTLKTAMVKRYIFQNMKQKLLKMNLTKKIN